jgi:hypothetical protein
MARKIGFLFSIVALSLLVVLPAYALPGAPNFGAGLWADDVQWGTKVTTPLPEPKKNWHSFDAFYFITPVGWTVADGPGGWLQAPVMEAAPGDPDYNGGRWYTVRVTVTNPGGIDFPLTSYAEIMQEQDEGDLTVGSMPEPDGAHPWLFFQCPLLPYK